MELVTHDMRSLMAIPAINGRLLLPKTLQIQQEESKGTVTV